MKATGTPRERLLALANGTTASAETWRRAVVAMIDDLNRAVHHERFRRLARYPRAPKESRIDVRPYPTGGASARVALGDGVRIKPKDLRLFRAAVAVVVDLLHNKARREPFRVDVRFDHPDDQSRPDLSWPLGMGSEATVLWNDLIGEPAGSPWRRIPAVPTGSLGRELRRPPAPLRMPRLGPPSVAEARELVLLARHNGQFARERAIRSVVEGAPDAARVVRAVRRMATSPHDARTMRPKGRRSRRARKGAA